VKRWPVIILLVVAVLGVMIPGCRDVPRYDSRLTAADSLMKDHADSALALLQAIDTAQLTGEGDRAYHDLLLTQARYKTYVTASSDSDINHALAYYRVHPSDREKLTRALIYKGAVMDELGFPDSAMLYYKQAEAAAAPDDYFNLGYAKMRIATLYQDQLSQDSAAIIRLKQAIRYFKAINDTNYLISCYGDLGAICGLTYPDSTEYYLLSAIELAKLYHSPKQFYYKSKLAGFILFHQKDYKRANSLAMEVFRNGKDDADEDQFYYYAVLSFLQLGHLDSAKYMLSVAPPPEDAVDSMMLFEAQGSISLYENDYKSFGISMHHNNRLSANLIDGLEEVKVIIAEKEFDKSKAIEEKDSALSMRDIIISLLFLGGLSVLFLAFSFYRKYHSSVEREKNTKQAIADLQSELDFLKEEQKNKNKYDTVSQLVALRISALNELYSSIRIRVSVDDENKKRVTPLLHFLKELNEHNQLLDLRLPDSFWEKLKTSVDGEYKGIASFVEKRYIDLSRDDIRLFCLLCARISPQIIMLCMDYKNPKTASNYRNKMVRQKFGLDMTFDKFVQSYLNGEIS